MSEWLRAALDVVLIIMVGAGLVQAARLIGHLAGLRQGRLDMERFVHEFNSTVIRAETGIKGLRQAARDSGDDLEKLVGKAVMVRDELQFIVESADLIAERLSQAATTAARPEIKISERAERLETERDTASPSEPQNKNSASPQTLRKPEPQVAEPTSRAEKELLQALKKLS